MQTNALALSDEWIHLLRSRKILLGVSLDGDLYHNRRRRDLRGKETFTRVTRNLRRLTEHGVRFSIICVVQRSNLPDGRQLVATLQSFQPTHIGFNIEETEGSNSAGIASYDDLVVFWRQVISESDALEQRGIREIDRIRAAIRSDRTVWEQTDLFPTVMHNGDVVLLSPEFAGIRSEEYSNFVVGNVLESELRDILSTGASAAYTQEFVAGVSLCSETCRIFSVCGGGQASNKYFEHGRLDGTMTEYCKGAKMAVVTAISRETHDA